MAEYVQSYLLNSSSLQTTEQNSQTIVPNIPLTGISRVALTINGVIYAESASGPTPIDGATVIAYGPDGAAVAQATSQTVGTQVGSYTLTFDGETNVNYTVMATLDGYEANTDVVIFTTSLTVSLSLLLGQESNLLAIYGKVIDANTGEAISGATIRIAGGGNVVIVDTMSDGTFVAYDDFTVGTSYTVTANMLGYESQSQVVTIAQGQVGRYVIFALNMTGINLTSITGRVVVEGSSPVVGIANAFVGLYVVDPTANPARQLVATTLTDEFGSYTFPNVDGNQNYIIKAIKVINVSTT